MALSVNLQRPRILVVDDDPALIEMLARALEDEGYEVSRCTDSREAARAADDLKPAAMLLDVLMPGTDGFEVLREIRKTPAGRRLPVVLMSGAWRAEERRRDLGATRDIAPTVVLPKPFRLSDLQHSLSQLGVLPR